MHHTRNAAFEDLAHHADAILDSHGILRAVDEDAWCWQLGGNRVYLGEDLTELGFSISLHRLCQESGGEKYWQCDHGSDRYVESPAQPEQIAEAIERRLTIGT
ncbi:MAG TPA: hypothetical protein VGF86_00660 [Candidatus Tumulicola sp.]|jgi:hypothetical protein